MSSFNTGAWSDEENKLFLEGYIKYGKAQNWSAIADIIKTRSEQQVKSRGRYVEVTPQGQAWLRGELQANPSSQEYLRGGELQENEDDDDISLDGTLRNGTWSEREMRLCLKGYKKYGNRNWDAITDHVKTRSKQQVMSQVSNVLRRQGKGHDIFAELQDDNDGASEEEDDEEEDDDISLDGIVREGMWSEREKRLYLKGFKKYGNRNWDAIVSLVKTRTKQQIVSRATTLLKRQREGQDIFAELQDDDDEASDEDEEDDGASPSDDEEKDSDQDGKRRLWTKAEKSRFLEGVKKYGKGNWDEIAALVKTRTRRQVIDLFYKTPEVQALAAELARDDDDEDDDETSEEEGDDDDTISLDGALREGTWSEREKRLFLEGYKKYGNRDWHAVTAMIKTRTHQQVMGRNSSLLRKQRAGHDAFTELEQEDDKQDGSDVGNSRKRAARVSLSPSAPPKFNSGAWSKEEQRLFEVGLRKHGRGQWKDIAKVVGTRNNDQVCNHAVSYFKRINAHEDTVDGVQECDDDVGNPRKRAARVSLSPSAPPKFNSGAWSKEEERLFEVGLQKHGRGQWKDIAKVVGTRDNVQVCRHAVNYFKRMEEQEDIVDGVQESADDSGSSPKKRAARASLPPLLPKLNQRRMEKEKEESRGEDEATTSRANKKRASARGIANSSISDEGEKKRRAIEDIPSSRESTKKQRRSKSSQKTITILGATGGTGICLIKQALAAGHTVKALVRSPQKFSYELSLNTNFQVGEGDVTNYADVKAALNGSTDVVVSLGGRGKDSEICSTAQPVVDKALNDTDPNMRLVVISSMAVGDSYHDVTWMTRRFADLVIPSSIKDKNLQERSVIKDTTNWCIVRPAGLSGGQLTGKVEADPHGAPAASKTMSRADLAHFILTQCLSGNDQWKRNPVTVFPTQ